jgi:CubicO group peptidase (beta-lactamase class C family)
VILVFKKGEMLLNKSYGYANLELSVPMLSDIFFIASVTKQFTAAAILKLVEDKNFLSMIILQNI